MKNSSTIWPALAVAAAALLAPSAYAGTVSSVTQDIVLVNNQASVEHLLTGGNAGFSFTDRYNFSTTGSGDLEAVLQPRAKNANSALSLTGFSLFDSSGKFVASSVANPADGGWLIDFDNLAAGSYYLQVNGKLMSNAAVKYFANLSFGPQVAAVPEPASAAMMLGGLGLLGAMVRRRKRAQ